MGKALGLRGSEVVMGWIERNTELYEEEEKCFAAGVLQVSVQWELSIVLGWCWTREQNPLGLPCSVCLRVCPCMCAQCARGQMLAACSSNSLQQNRANHTVGSPAGTGWAQTGLQAMWVLICSSGLGGWGRGKRCEHTAWCCHCEMQLWLWSGRQRGGKLLPAGTAGGLGPGLAFIPALCILRTAPSGTF